MGLSPRVRGSHVAHTLAVSRPGSIPAGAGEPTGGCGRRVALRVYPRGCGGAGQAVEVGGQWRGLSPRVRGSPCPENPAR